MLGAAVYAVLRRAKGYWMLDAGTDQFDLRLLFNTLKARTFSL